jgi:hypothetical protein
MSYYKGLRPIAAWPSNCLGSPFILRFGGVGLFISGGFYLVKKIDGYFEEHDLKYLREVTGETSIPLYGRGAPKGQLPTGRNETLRQKDCNLIQSWKASVL